MCRSKLDKKRVNRWNASQDLSHSLQMSMKTFGGRWRQRCSCTFCNCCGLYLKSPNSITSLSLWNALNLASSCCTNSCASQSLCLILMNAHFQFFNCENDAKLLNSSFSSAKNSVCALNFVLFPQMMSSSKCY